MVCWAFVKAVAGVLKSAEPKGSLYVFALSLYIGNKSTNLMGVLRRRQVRSKFASNASQYANKRSIPKS